LACEKRRKKSESWRAPHALLLNPLQSRSFVLFNRDFNGTLGDIEQAL
jgi:hypothetical protein